MDRDDRTPGPMAAAEEKEKDVEGASPARPSLTRSADDQMIAGVAGGLARHFGWDATAVRIGFLVSTLLGGAGFVAYVFGWIVMPRQGDRRDLRDRLNDLPSWVLPVAGIVVFLTILGDTGWMHPGAWIALVLVVAGVMLLRESPAERSAAASARTPADDRSPDTATEAVPVTRTRRPRREPSFLGLFTVGIALLAVAAAAVLDRIGALDMDAGRYFALGLTTVGAGLLVGTVYGRGRSLIPLGLLLLPVVTVASLVQVPFEGFVGDRYLSVVGPVGDRSYKMLAGDMTVDLREADATEGAVIDLQMTFGVTQIEVPSGWGVRFVGELQGGEMRIFGERFEGLSLSLDRAFGPSDAEQNLVINLEAGFGEVVVQRTGYFFE